MRASHAAASVAAKVLAHRLNDVDSGVREMSRADGNDTSCSISHAPCAVEMGTVVATIASEKATNTARPGLWPIGYEATQLLVHLAWNDHFSRS